MRRRVRRLAIVGVAVVGVVASIATSAPYDFHTITITGPPFAVGQGSPSTFEVTICSSKLFAGRSGIFREAKHEPELTLSARTAAGEAAMVAAHEQRLLSEERTELRLEFEVHEDRADRYCSDPIPVAFEALTESADVDWDLTADMYLEIASDDTPITIEVRQP